MRNMSFAMTTEQVRNQTKSVTRRFGWWFLKPGDVVQPVVKGMGLKKGEKVEKIGPPIRIVSTRRELVGDVTAAECVREGFPGMSPSYFVRLLTDDFRKATITSPVNRIEFVYLDNAERQRSAERAEVEPVSDCCGAPLLFSCEDPCCRECLEHCDVANAVSEGWGLSADDGVHAVAGAGGDAGARLPRRLPWREEQRNGRVHGQRAARGGFAQRSSQG